jgi:predicted enzyme related to lactoylglutathione lyase
MPEQRPHFAAASTPVAFVYVTDRARALAFYQGVLGLTLHQSDGYGDFLTTAGALVRMTVMPDHKPSAHPVLGWDVADIGAAARELTARGVVFSWFDGMPMDELGVWTSPDGKSKLAFFADPDGNALMLSQG